MHIKQKTHRNFNRLFSATKNQIIVTVSRHSQYAISYFFPHIAGQIVPLYSPKKIVFETGANEYKIMAEMGVVPKKFILLICGDRPEKGAYRACAALKKLLLQSDKNLNGMKVLILGVTYKKPYKRLLGRLPQFIMSDYVTPIILETLYKNAHLFIYPTMNEGFGYPPLEAMKYGTLCACSANSAVTEVCGNAVLYFNPFDETEIGIRVLQSFDEEIRNEKSVFMKKQYEKIQEKQNTDLEHIVDIILQEHKSFI
jgi:hypothetical protein